jgi:hypothetical protein
MVRMALVFFSKPRSKGRQNDGEDFLTILNDGKISLSVGTRTMLSPPREIALAYDSVTKEIGIALPNHIASSEATLFKITKYHQISCKIFLQDNNLMPKSKSQRYYYSSTNENGILLFKKTRDEKETEEKSIGSEGSETIPISDLNELFSKLFSGELDETKRNEALKILMEINQKNISA